MAGRVNRPRRCRIEPTRTSTCGSGALCGVAELQAFPPTLRCSGLVTAPGIARRGRARHSPMALTRRRNRRPPVRSRRRAASHARQAACCGWGAASRARLMSQNLEHREQGIGLKRTQLSTAVIEHHLLPQLGPMRGQTVTARYSASNHATVGSLESRLSGMRCPCGAMSVRCRGHACGSVPCSAKGESSRRKPRSPAARR
jgi:hypothetical protein